MHPPNRQMIELVASGHSRLRDIKDVLCWRHLLVFVPRSLQFLGNFHAIADLLGSLRVPRAILHSSAAGSVLPRRGHPIHGAI
jgi:hypothetical protein